MQQICSVSSCFRLQGYVYITASPPSCSNSTDQQEERVRLRSHGSALRGVCTRQEEPRVGDNERTARGLWRGWADRLQHTRSALQRGVRPLRTAEGVAGKEGPQEPGEGELYVWVFLANGCREARWSCARLQRAPLSPSLSRALKIHPETKTSMCV